MTAAWDILHSYRYGIGSSKLGLPGGCDETRGHREIQYLQGVIVTHPTAPRMHSSVGETSDHAQIGGAAPVLGENDGSLTKRGHVQDQPLTLDMLTEAVARK